MKKILFIDRDGTIINEHETFQIDRFDKLVFYPKVFEFLGKISKELDYKLVMVSNQDWLGTDSYPKEDFKMTIKILESANINKTSYKKQRGILSNRLKQSLVNLDIPFAYDLSNIYHTK